MNEPPMNEPPTNALETTRRTLHGIAEHLLSAHGRRNGGSVRLFVTVRGMQTRPPHGDTIALADDVLVRRPDGPTVPLTGTLGSLADALGVPFGMPDPPYPLASGCGPDDAVLVDRTALTTLVDDWALGAQALRLIAARHRLTEREPALWPEHFDVGLTVAEVNLGVSPGDAAHPEPYAYIGPWTARTGPFWNAPFGALRPMRDLPDVDAVLDYFELGLRHAGVTGTADRSTPPTQSA